MATHRTGAGSRIPADTLRAIHRIWDQPGPRVNPAQIHAQLKRDRLDKGVTVRTVERIVAGLRVEDDGTPWSLTDSAGEDVSLVLDVVRALIEESGEAGAWPVRPSRTVAEWIVRIRRAYPDLNDYPLIYYLAAVGRRGGEYLEKVETFLAFTPWRDHGEALARAIDRKLVSFDVAFSFGYEMQVATWQGRFNIERKEQRQ